MVEPTQHEPVERRRLPGVLGRRWGWLLALGILMVIIGFFALGSTLVATLATIIFFGIVLLAGGITQIALAFTAIGWRGFTLHLLVGILGGVVGLILLLNPVAGAAAITLLLALWLLVSGVGQIVHAFTERFAHWGLAVTSGGISTFLGIILLAQGPVSSLWFLGLYIGIYLLVQGITWMALALAAHSAAGPMPRHA